MSLFTNMQQALSQIPGMLGGSLQIRRLTSSTGAQGARVYAAAAAFSGLIQGKNFQQENDHNGMMAYVRHDSAELYVDSSISVNLGDLIIDTDGTTQWAVVAQLTSGAGTNAFRLASDTAYRGAPDRNGGV